MLTVPPLSKRSPAIRSRPKGGTTSGRRFSRCSTSSTRASGTLTVAVKAKGAGTIVDYATVTAVPANGGERPFRIAQFAGASVQLYQIQNLLPGKYDLVVEAPGFAKGTRDRHGRHRQLQQLSVEMTPTEVTLVMPNLFGLPVNVAMDPGDQRGADRSALSSIRAAPISRRAASPNRPRLHRC